MICAEQNKKISFLITYNPFSNRTVFSFIPVLACWYMAIHYHAMYQTSDDMDMRILLEGSIGGSISEPSEFTLYMNVLYGKFLKLFYTVYQNGYWYDMFTYIFASASLFVLVMSVCKDFERESLFAKILKLVIITFVGATPFISPQFTMTSGLLAMSGVLSFYMWVSEYFTGKKAQFACAGYCVFALVFSSLIRFECCMIVGFFTGMLLLPCWPYKEWKRHLQKCCVVIGALLVILGVHFLDGYIVSQNPQWDEMRKANSARVEITDKTNMWDNLITPWGDVEDSIDLLKDKDNINFSKADYRMLLSASFLGNTNINNPNNLNKVVDIIRDSVQRFNSKSAGFRVADYRNVMPSFIVLALVIFCLSITEYKKNTYYIGLFVLFIVCLNMEFRALPYRLWYNFAFATIIMALIHFRIINISNKTKYIKIICLLLIVFGIQSSYTIMYNQAKSTKYQYGIYKSIREDIKYLPKDNIYISYYAVLEHVAAPFRRNILDNVIIASPLSFHGQYKKFFMEKDIYYNTFWSDVCNRNKKIRLLYRSDVYDGGWSALKYSIPYYMKEKYGKDVVFLYQKIGNFFVTQCIALTEDESKIKKVYEQKIKPLAVSDDIKLIMKYELIRDTLGYWASYQDMAEVFTILNGEFIKSE